MDKYVRLINRLIANSNFSLKEISDKCREYGTNVTISYLSKLKNGAMPAPSFRVTVTIAKVLQVEPEKLIAAAVYDKKMVMLSEIKEALESYYPTVQAEELEIKAKKYVFDECGISEFGNKEEVHRILYVYKTFLSIDQHSKEIFNGGDIL